MRLTITSHLGRDLKKSTFSLDFDKKSFLKKKAKIHISLEGILTGFGFDVGLVFAVCPF